MKSKTKKQLIVMLTLLTVLGVQGGTVCHAAVRGTVSGTLSDSYVTGKITCSETGHKLSVYLTYGERDNQSGKSKLQKASNSTFGNNTEAVQTNLAGTYCTIHSLIVEGTVDDVTKQTVKLTSYGSSTLEYW